MCGLIAFSGSGGDAPDFSEALAVIRHRGPDDSGLYSAADRECVLGHVRLSILDLSASGHQPMVDPSERYVIAYNGEVYNFRELRAELESAHGALKWKSTSDTEVVLRGVALEGMKFLSRLNGIFALAVYDTSRRELHVLRDPLGIKPLFFAQVPRGVVFCSELKGILAVPGLDLTLRLMSVAEQLAFMYVPEPNTFFESVSKVEPGILHTWKRGRLIARVPLFTHLVEPLEKRSNAEWVDSFRTGFAQAVRRQLVSDAPVSIMLSGGLDSSAVAWEAVNAGASFRSAYTIAYSNADMQHDQQSDDLKYARRMSDELGLQLEVIPADDGLLANLPGLAPYLEDGISDPAALNTYLICRAAREQGVKVMLTGQGADEYLAGYRRHLGQEILSRMSPWKRRLISLIDLLLPVQVPGRFNALVRRFHRLGRMVRQSPEDRIPGMFMWADHEAVQRLMAAPLADRLGQGMHQLFAGFRHLGDAEALLRVDQLYDLRSLNLTYCDRLSMAAGVEARVPFLDFDLVRLMNSIPVDLKLRGGVGKYILKKAMEGRLPRDVIYREKAGFGLPLRAWLRRDSRLVDRYLDFARIERDGIFAAEQVRELCDAQFRGVADNANVIFSLICFQLWREGRGLAGVR